MDMEGKYIELININKVDVDEYGRTTVQIVEKMDSIGRLANSISEIEQSTNERLKEFISFHYDTSQHTLSSITNIKEKMTNICKKIIELHKNLEEIEMEGIRSKYLVKENTLKNDLEEFKHKKR